MIDKTLTDRDLLELAAKAYFRVNGFEWNASSDFIEYIPEGRRSYSRWNPLADDTDAFRLAVNLNISIYSDNESYVFAVTQEDRMAETSDPEACLGWCESRSSDENAATRRAIVRAAAEIGRTQSANT